MAKQPAPVALTGGSGFNYEDCVAGRFLIDLLGGIATFGPDFGHVVGIGWQTRDSGRLLDDLTVMLEASDGEHTAEISIKSHRQVTGAGFPTNFVQAAWEEWFHTESSTFRTDRDLLVLVTGEIANDAMEAWGTLLRESLATDPDRMVSRLQERVAPDEGCQSSETERALFASLHCPDSLLAHGPRDQLVTIEVIRRVRLLHFDFRSEPSRDEGRAIADCQVLLRSGDFAEAQKFWQAVVRVAAENREVGGSLDLAGLLTRLRPYFELVDHPDFREDWLALERAGRDVLDDVRTEIGGVTSVNRESELQTLSNTLADVGICLAAGESGCGKSALAKSLGASSYGTTIALSPDLFEAGSLQRLEQQLNLRHPLIEILSAGRDLCLLVLDSMERYSERGLRLAGRIVADLLADKRCRHVHILLVMHFDAAGRVIDRLAVAGVEHAKLNITPIDCPPEAVIRDLLKDVPRVSWATLHHDMRPLLRNLKILDWVVRAAQSGGRLNTSQVTGLIPLIDYLWDCWVEPNHEGLARSELLKRLAAIEASTLTAGVPLRHLNQVEQQQLADLIISDLLRRRNERIRFSHDLLGDWARLKVLIGEDPTRSSEGLHRCAAARWYRAVRLFGRWLLAQPDGVRQWSQAIRRADDGTTEGTVVRDLLLESVVVTENSRKLLELAWPVLAGGGGRLLMQLLDRFLFVATIPDLRLPRVVKDRNIAPQVEAAFRVPLWAYWGALLKTLDEHVGDVCLLAPAEAGRVCRVWLEKMPAEIVPGIAFPWRAEAARIALRLAREMQAQRAEGRYVSHGEDRVAYEAALLSAHDLTDDVVAFALEMAGRRPPSPDIQSRADVAHQAAQEAAQRRDAEDPDRARRLRRLCRPVYPRGPLREPWPDGPSRQVESAFREAVLDSMALLPLADVCPEAAVEVLLAVCIEPPGYDDPFDGSDLIDNCGLEFWQEGYPAMYFRGPFLQFISLCPAHGIDFIIRLINFASNRWSTTETRDRARRGPSSFPQDEDDSHLVAARIGDEERNWRGDCRVFRWHLDWPVDCKIITCTLMALEKWLYEQIEAGNDVERWLQQILERSETVAFAGLLIDVGKREPRYFGGCLRPLLGVSAFYLWELQILMERSSTSVGLMGWWNQPRELANMARDWHTAAHRRCELSRIAVWLMFHSSDIEAFFVSCRDRWSQELNSEGEPRLLRLLIERFDRRNYTETPVDGGQVRIEFVAPPALMRQVEADQIEAGESMRLLTFPIDCRRILDGEKELIADELPYFWRVLQAIAEQAISDKDDHTRRCDVIAGGVAVLLRFHRDWLDGDPVRLTWCLEELQHIASDPPPRREFDFADSAGDWTWDCFLAEAGVCLLRETPLNHFVRDVVARGVAGYHYGTTARTMRLAYCLRDSLGNDFKLMQQLAIRWSVIRRLRDQSGHYLTEVEHRLHFDASSSSDLPTVDQLRTECEKWRDEHAKLIDQFEGRTIAPMSLREAGETGSVEVERLTSIRFPARRTRPPHSDQESGFRSRRKLFRIDLGLDRRVIQAAFSWLDLSSAVAQTERRVILDHVRDLLALLLDSLQPSLAPGDDECEKELDGLPDNFDGWVFGRLARTIAQMRDDEQPSSIWQPILGLGLHAHEWIKRFFWYWFSDGVNGSRSPEVFSRRWIEMLHFTFASPSWDPAAVRAHCLDGMVFELLGYHFGMDSIAADEQFAPILERIIPVIATAAQRWFAMPRVANGFAQSLTQPGYDRLLCPGIQWLHRAMSEANAYEFWRQRDIESNLISALNRCWERFHEVVAADSELQSAFLGLVTALVSRGSHAAMALRERLLDSIPQTE